MSSVESTLKERGSRYGDFKDQAHLAVIFKETMRCYGWEKLAPFQKQALDTIVEKISRILSGDPNYADNWHDIQGYAKLVEDRLDNGDARG